MRRTGERLGRLRQKRSRSDEEHQQPNEHERHSDSEKKNDEHSTGRAWLFLKEKHREHDREYAERSNGLC